MVLNGRNIFAAFLNILNYVQYILKTCTTFTAAALIRINASYVYGKIIRMKDNSNGDLDVRVYVNTI